MLEYDSWPSLSVNISNNKLHVHKDPREVWKYSISLTHYTLNTNEKLSFKNTESNGALDSSKETNTSKLDNELYLVLHLFDQFHEVR